MVKSIKKNALTIVFSSINISSLMYLLNPPYIIVSSILSLVISALLFYYYDFIKSKGKNASIYYLLSYLAVFCILFLYSNTLSSRPAYEILNFFLFREVTDGITFQYWIIVSIILCILITSFVFYFTNVIFRSSAMFMISLIPCALFTKRSEDIPLIILILIITFYIVVMIHCKQVRLSKSTNIRMNSSYKKSLFIFTIIIVIITVAIPKPNYTPYRSKFLNLFEDNISDDESTSRYSSNFSNIRNYYNQLSDKIIFEVEADEPLYLRFQVFDLYNNKKNYWQCYTKNEFGYGKSNWREKVYCNDFLKSIKIIDNIVKSTNLSDKYQITLPQIDEKLSNKKSAVITYKNYKITSFLNTINTYDLISEDEPTYKNQNNEIFYGSGDDNYMYPNSSYEIFYNAESIYSNDIIDYAKSFNINNYGEYLSDLVHYTEDKDKLRILVDTYYDYYNTKDYYENTYTASSDRIKELALDITKDCNSDIEKALALQDYFKENGYYYDLKYVPPQGHEDIEYFIFDSKRGICSDYATALTIMAREIGLPARYVEGYYVHEKGNDGKYIVREKHGHAFTEIYISGIGWMTFDATVSRVDTTTQADTFSNIGLWLSNLDAKYLLIIIGSIFVLFIAYQILVPIFVEYFFRIRIKFKNNSIRIQLLFTHLRDIIAKKNNLKAESITCDELKAIALKKYNYNISSITNNFDNHVFGGLSIARYDWKVSYSQYKNIYKIIKKKNRKNKKRKKT